MNHPEDPLNLSPEGQFLYLAESNSMLNLGMIGLITFEGAAESPSSVVHLGGNIPPLVLHGRDVVWLAEALHIDLQAVQTRLQHAKAAQDSHAQ